MVKNTLYFVLFVALITSQSCNCSKCGDKTPTGSFSIRPTFLHPIFCTSNLEQQITDDFNQPGGGLNIFTTKLSDTKRYYVEATVSGTCDDKSVFETNHKIDKDKSMTVTIDNGGIFFTLNKTYPGRTVTVHLEVFERCYKQENCGCGEEISEMMLDYSGTAAVSVIDGDIVDLYMTSLDANKSCSCIRPE